MPRQKLPTSGGSGNVGDGKLYLEIFIGKVHGIATKMRGIDASRSRLASTLA